jgi:flagellar hook-associated protein 1 FlgK
MIALLDTDAKKRARQEREIRAAASRLARAGWDGKGIEAAVIAEARDPLLNAQILAEASVTGSLAAQQKNLQHAGTCLDELINFSAAPNALSSLDGDLSNLFSAIEALSEDPANSALRRKAVRNAREIAAKFNHAASRLNCLKSDLNASIQKDVIQANQHIDHIAALNQQIMEARTTGLRAVNLAAQREQFLEALSTCVNIIVARRVDGGVNVVIGGVAMITGAKTPDGIATYPDQNENLRIQAPNAGIRLKLEGGSIAGKITARDGALAGLQSGLDRLASQLIKRFNSQDFFAGTNASDISVKNAVAGLPAGAGGAKGANANDTMTPSLKAFGQRYIKTVSNLNISLSKVSDELSSSQAITQMLAHERDSAHCLLIGQESAALHNYEQACVVLGKTRAKLTKMAPMR